MRVAPLLWHGFVGAGAAGVVVVVVVVVLVVFVVRVTVIVLGLRMQEQAVLNAPLVLESEEVHFFQEELLLSRFLFAGVGAVVVLGA
jgi:hypothetical protein